MNNYKSKEGRDAAAARVALMLARRYVSVDVAIALVGMPRQSVYKWGRDGVVSCVRIGKFMFLSLDDLKAKAPGAFGKKDPVIAARALISTAARAANGG